MHCDAPGFRVRPAVSEYMYVKDLTNVSRYEKIRNSKGKACKRLSIMESNP